jgi:hypothetical protein
LRWAAARVPQGKLWVIAELVRIRRINLECVQPPSACNRIAGLANTDALPEGLARKSVKGEVAYQPAICDRIIESKRVSLIIESARIVRRQRGEE